jgi:hypothetical protein
LKRGVRDGIRLSNPVFPVQHGFPYPSSPVLTANLYYRMPASAEPEEENNMFSYFIPLLRPIGILLFSGLALMGCREMTGGKSPDPVRTCKTDLRRFNPPLDSVMHFRFTDTQWNSERTEERTVDSGFREVRILSIGADSFSFAKKDSLTFVADSGGGIAPTLSESTFTMSFTYFRIDPQMALTGCLEDIEMTKAYGGDLGMIYRFTRAEVDADGVLRLDIYGNFSLRAFFFLTTYYAEGRGPIRSISNLSWAPGWEPHSAKIERTD